MTERLYPTRQARIVRRTNETNVEMTLDLDGHGEVKSDTGVPFLDHMLAALGKHSQFDITVTCAGDASMDPHHSVEDIGIVLGQALRQALGDRAGVRRFGHAYAPLDEALARVVADCSGRPFLHYEVSMPEALVAPGFASSLIVEFWRALAMNAALTLHVDLVRSQNAHHAAEAIFKAAAVALREATRFSARDPHQIPSTKGVLA
ncbi:MAG: imidazoleglycerol-phosphate dehydratase HisB [Chloroflexota bacterium]|nr:imidazoleglycerol-phosphate dehydratase HisB [Chloroflexota bacterium]